MARRWLLWCSLAIGLGAGVWILQATFGVPSWLMSRGTAPAQDAAPIQLWSFAPAEHGAILASPLVVEARIFIPVIQDRAGSSVGAVYCLDRETGRQIWKFDNDGHMRQTFSAPCLANGRLYFGEGMHDDFRCRLYCFDAVRGRKIWDLQAAGHIESSPSVAKGRVYFGAGDDGVYCVDAATGAKHWRHGGGLHVDTSPVVVGERVYAGSGRSVAHKTTAVFALDTRDGQTIWQQPTDLPVWGSPRIDGGQVFVGLGNGRLIVQPAHPAGAVLCLDAGDGRINWRWSGHEAVFDRPAVDAHAVYFGCRDGNCYCLERNTGHVRWQTNLGSAVIAAPVLSSGCVYATATDGRLYRLNDADGGIEWTLSLIKDVHSRARCVATPTVMTEAATGDQLIYIAGEFMNRAGSVPMFYALRDTFRRHQRPSS